MKPEAKQVASKSKPNSMINAMVPNVTVPTATTVMARKVEKIEKASTHELLGSLQKRKNAESSSSSEQNTTETESTDKKMKMNETLRDLEKLSYEDLFLLYKAQSGNEKCPYEENEKGRADLAKYIWKLSNKMEMDSSDDEAEDHRLNQQLKLKAMKENKNLEQFSEQENKKRKTSNTEQNTDLISEVNNNNNKWDCEKCGMKFEKNGPGRASHCRSCIGNSTETKEKEKGTKSGAERRKIALVPPMTISVPATVTIPVIPKMTPQPLKIQQKEEPKPVSLEAPPKYAAAAALTQQEQELVVIQNQPVSAAPIEQNSALQLFQMQLLQQQQQAQNKVKHLQEFKFETPADFSAPEDATSTLVVKLRYINNVTEREMSIIYRQFDGFKKVKVTLIPMAPVYKQSIHVYFRDERCAAFAKQNTHSYCLDSTDLDSDLNVRYFRERESSRDVKFDIICPLCNTSFSKDINKSNIENNWKQHLRTQEHRRLLAAENIVGPEYLSYREPWYCSCCSSPSTSGRILWFSHATGRSHNLMVHNIQQESVVKKSNTVDDPRLRPVKFEGVKVEEVGVAESPKLPFSPSEGGIHEEYKETPTMEQKVETQLSVDENGLYNFGEHVEGCAEYIKENVQKYQEWVDLAGPEVTIKILDNKDEIWFYGPELAANKSWSVIQKDEYIVKKKREKEIERKREHEVSLESSRIPTIDRLEDLRTDAVKFGIKPFNRERCHKLEVFDQRNGNEVGKIEIFRIVDSIVDSWKSGNAQPHSVFEVLMENETFHQIKDVLMKKYKVVFSVTSKEETQVMYYGKPDDVAEAYYLVEEFIYLEKRRGRVRNIIKNSEKSNPIPPMKKSPSPRPKRNRCPHFLNGKCTWYMSPKNHYKGTNKENPCRFCGS